jgi:hypothetical protein
MGNYLSNTTNYTTPIDDNTTEKFNNDNINLNNVDVSDCGSSTREENINTVVSELVDDMIQKVISELGNSNNKSTNTEPLKNDILIESLISEYNDQRGKYYILVNEYEHLKGQYSTTYNNLHVARNQNMKLRKDNYFLTNNKTHIESDLRNIRFKNYYLKELIEEMRNNIKIRQDIINKNAITVKNKIVNFTKNIYNPKLTKYKSALF